MKAINKIRIEMVDVDALINLLINVWEDGADYVDLELTKKEDVDLIHIIPREETKEEENGPVSDMNVLSENDINNLLD
jgi:hypothetical protein